MKFHLNNKTVLITGGTGSFGSAVVNRLLEQNIGEIRIFSRDEKKQNDMRIFYNDRRIKYFIGDVRELNSTDDAMIGVDYVFHAAALKQVPSCEFYPMEAVRTNVLGAENVMRSALAAKVKVCVVLSTDKAVYPINAMGISKAMMEKIMVAKSMQCDEQGGTILCATRYGNVMGSRGSVIPLFLEQIKNNQPLTITDSNMTRFLMSLEESVNLVFYAFENANPGDIFVQKSPASTIRDLAIAMKEIFSSSLDAKVIGTRHGEKLFESLVSREEMARAVDEGSFYRIPADVRDLNYSKYFSDGDSHITEHEDYTSHNTRRLDVDEVKNLLLKLDFIQEALT
ncbi:polysaccharide biosynthesis protein [Polynucleobacter sp. es-GGE-1]|uniref:polysaccharide biosynthesis protein n=1 Tax=Polynucleobacter sp. es-GGE-1 TaxID=1819724 RepID=UPI001C0CB5F8|nr:polysaccharide biosynthesis protein [Polynucleobacter sp. es-GGE-1]MBU3635555.1 polysaccharide biosynthesis protein [Polynucleobacter sp. es-GGE-1]